MGLYARWVFPALCHLSLRGGEIDAERRRTLAPVRGDVLEIGIGSGLNLPWYPAGVERVVGVDPNPGMARLARPAAQAASFAVERVVESAEELPFEAGSFDFAVSTWTLCSLPRPARALAEVHRVLRPGGRLVFVEHGLAEDRGVARWQRRLTPLQRRFADGCHLDRDIAAIVAASPLELVRLDRTYLKGIPRIAGFLYRGEAVRA